jgi:hypothetical protein
MLAAMDDEERIFITILLNGFCQDFYPKKYAEIKQPT